MNEALLNTIYDPEDFRKRGHLLVDSLADHLDAVLHEKTDKVIPWTVPEEEQEFWQDFMLNGSEEELFGEIVKRCIHVHHPRYMGHQISPTAPITALTATISALLNNGMGIYEMGAAPTALERIVTDHLCKEVGYAENARGFLTSGGTLANLTALISARKRIAKHNVWDEGIKNKLAIMVSEEAHYCIGRAAKIMGLREEGIIKIPVDDRFAMRTDLLEKHYSEALDQGLRIFAVVGSAPSTATGIYDDLETMAQFASEKKLWFHVDAAHGGAALFSKKYRHLVKASRHSDSIVIDGHKMMMMPSITTALLFRNGEDSHHTFRQKADYLLQESQEEDWYNLAKRTFECTKYMMSLHWYTLLKVYGKDVFQPFVTKLYDLGAIMAEKIEATQEFELAVSPDSNIVCFRYLHSGLDTQGLNTLNRNLRQELLEEGQFYIVQTTLRGISYLRVTLMNPFTTPEHLERLLSKIKDKAKPLALALQYP